MFKEIHHNRWFIWCLVFICSTAVVIVWQVQLYTLESEHAVVEPVRVPNKAKVDNPASNEALDVSTTYTNTDYGFTFKYPDSWIQHNIDWSPRSSLNADFLFSINFSNPSPKGSELVDVCTNYYNTGILPQSLTEKQCDDIIDDARHPSNIFIRVFKTEKSLDAWLIEHYKLPHSELQDYTLGADISLGSEEGYLSSTGCCLGIDQAYVVKKNGYIYEFGSNATRAEELIEEFAGGFRFIQN